MADQVRYRGYLVAEADVWGSAKGEKGWRASAVPLSPTLMKFLISTSVFVLALAIAGPVFAADATAAKTELDCQKAGGVWDGSTEKCKEPDPQGDQEIEKELQQENQ